MNPMNTTTRAIPGMGRVSRPLISLLLNGGTTGEDRLRLARCGTAGADTPRQWGVSIVVAERLSRDKALR
jgi:hypothetical protein